MEDSFSTYWVGRGMGCFKRVTLIVHFVSLIITPASPQIVR